MRVLQLGRGQRFFWNCSSATSAHVAQSVEHFLGKEEVTGSNPVVGFPNLAAECRTVRGTGPIIRSYDNERFDFTFMRHLQGTQLHDQ